MAEKSDKQQLDERVLEVSRQMLRGYQNKSICQNMSVEWDVSERQINRYIKKAYGMWYKEYKKKLKAGLAYHMAIRMKLYEEAYKGNRIKITKIKKGEKVTIERVENQDFRLCLEIAKDIAKLEGIYPAEKHKVDETRKVIVIGGKEEEDEEKVD